MITKARWPALHAAVLTYAFTCFHSPFKRLVITASTWITTTGTKAAA
ncbi:hypothetical protein [Domibacillus robiginosus]|nr:hypothetical protein [Domibacillus robiginosus]